MNIQYIVRGGPHKGQYITNRIAPSKTRRKYAWTPHRSRVVTLTYEQAKGVVRRYGGEIVPVWFIKNKSLNPLKIKKLRGFIFI